MIQLYKILLTEPTAAISYKTGSQLYGRLHTQRLRIVAYGFVPSIISKNKTHFSSVSL